MTTFDFLRREPDIRTYKQGETIFKQGDPADCMFAVVGGAVDIELGGVVVDVSYPSPYSVKWLSSTSNLAAPRPSRPPTVASR
jgi:DNA polymerase II small subunit/DNA polymerase delta subunit B